MMGKRKSRQGRERGRSRANKTRVKRKKVERHMSREGPRGGCYAARTVSEVVVPWPLV